MPCSVKNAITRFSQEESLFLSWNQLNLFLKYQLTIQPHPSQSNTGSINKGYFVWCIKLVFINCIFSDMFILKQYVREVYAFLW